MWDSGGMAPLIFNFSNRRGDWSAIPVAVLSPKPLLSSWQGYGACVTSVEKAETSCCSCLE